MNSNQKIVWLASYPKSGNTWLRIFLEGIVSDGNDDFSINRLKITDGISSNRYLFEECVGVNSQYLTINEIDNYLPRVFAKRAERSETLSYIKTHSANSKNRNGEYIFPSEITSKTIYIVRNPLDVCVSMAFHSGNKNFDLSTKNINNNNFYLATGQNTYIEQLHQFLGSWSTHYRSWVQSMSSQKLLVVRYEDMKGSPEFTFKKILAHLGLEYSADSFIRAMENSKFSKLSNQESKDGFKEKPIKSSKFFRKGIVGGWREYLSTSHVESIIEEHKETMEELNYISEAGDLLI